MPKTLLIGGGGYVGGVLADVLLGDGSSVTTTSRCAGRADLVVGTGCALDDVLTSRRYEQIVHLPQLTSSKGDWFLDRIDGPRWLVFSSAQLSSTVPAKGAELAVAREATALSRGATVLRPTMIFGRGGDRNISRVVRFLRRYRLPIIVGDGGQLVQPVHVEDVAALVVAHGKSPVAGLFEVGGDRRLTTRDLMDELRQHLGLRRRPVALPSRSLEVLAALRVPGFSADQLLRLREDKVVDENRAREAFGWSPGPLEERLRQAVREAS